MYLVVDETMGVSLWESAPIYFSDSERWSRPGAPLIRGAESPQLEEIATRLKLLSGPKGIVEVTMDLHPVKSGGLVKTTVAP